MDLRRTARSLSRSMIDEPLLPASSPTRNTRNTPHVTPPSQAGVGFGLWLGSPVCFFRSIGQREIKLRRHQGPTAGGRGCALHLHHAPHSTSTKKKPTPLRSPSLALISPCATPALPLRYPCATPALPLRYPCASPCATSALPRSFWRWTPSKLLGVGCARSR